MSSDSWPPLNWEERPWRSSIDLDLLPRAARSRASQRYRSALVPNIATAVLDLPAGTAALDAEATAAIARFDADAGHQIAPFTTLLLRSESASSSMIENLTSGAKAVALAEIGATDKRNARAIVANVAAMNAAIALADRLDADALLAMHRALMAQLEPAGPGSGGRSRSGSVVTRRRRTRPPSSRRTTSTCPAW